MCNLVNYIGMGIFKIVLDKLCVVIESRKSLHVSVPNRAVDRGVAKTRMLG